MPPSTSVLTVGKATCRHELVKWETDLGGFPKAVPLVVSAAMVRGDFALVSLAWSRLGTDSIIQSDFVLCTGAGHCTYPHPSPRPTLVDSF